MSFPFSCGSAAKARVGGEGAGTQQVRIQKREGDNQQCDGGEFSGQQQPSVATPFRIAHSCTQAGELHGERRLLIHNLHCS